MSTGGVDSPKVRDSDVRIFVALFSYEPATMSPNPDAAEEELPFSEGQIIKVRPRNAQIHAVPLSLAEINPDGVATGADLLKSDVCRWCVCVSPQVHGDKDPDGFYRGECGGRLGFVPCNMVSEIQVEDEETRQQLLQQGYLSTAASMDKIGERSLL